MKKLLSILLCFVMCLSFVGCGEERPSQYQNLTLSTLGNDVDSNLARATEKYVGNYYSFSAELSYISKDATSITAYEINPSYELGVCIHGEILDKEDRNIILQAEEGDIIKIKGKITDIGLGFMISADVKMDIYEIKIN